VAQAQHVLVGPEAERVQHAARNVMPQVRGRGLAQNQGRQSVSQSVSQSDEQNVGGRPDLGGHGILPDVDMTPEAHGQQPSLTHIQAHGLPS
jgi:hypothetical protein